MRCDRRTFVDRSLAVAGSLMTGAATSEAANSEAPHTDLFSRMRWMNEPASFKRLGETMVTDNGHLFNLEATGDFRFKARVNAQYAPFYNRGAPWSGSTLKIR